MAVKSDKRARKAKRSLGVRLHAGSFLLSRSAVLSARLKQRFFSTDETEKTHAEYMDEALQSSAAANAMRALDYKNTITRPFRKLISAGARDSAFLARTDALRKAFFHTKARFFGIAGVFFSLYSAGGYFIKRYVDFDYLHFGEAHASDLGTTAAVLLLSLLLLFCAQPVNTLITKSRIFSGVFEGVLGVHPDAWRTDPNVRVGTHAGPAFLVGVFLGLLTLFFRAHTVLLGAVAVAFCLCIPTYPEMGVLAAVTLMPIAPFRVLGVLLIFSVIGYVQKLLRFKRVLRIRVPEVFLTLTLFIAGLTAVHGDTYAFCRLAVLGGIWILSVSLFSTPRLYQKFLDAPIYGGILVLTFYAVNGLAPMYFPQFYIPYLPPLLSSRVLGSYMLMLFPLCLRQRRTFRGFLLFVLMIVNAYLLHSYWLLLGLVLAYFVYLALTSNAWLTPVAVGTLTIPLIVLTVSDRLGRVVTGFAPATHSLAFKYFFTGVGSGTGALVAAAAANGLPWENFSADLYTRLLTEGGVLYLLSFGACVFFALQRLLSCKKRSSVSGKKTLGGLEASIMLFLISSIFTDVWSDLRLLGIFWCLCASASLSAEVYGYSSQKEDDWQWI